MRFSKKKYLFKIDKMTNLLQNAYRMVLFRKNVFSALIMSFFGEKNWKVSKNGKIRKYVEENVFPRKKSFQVLRILLYKNGKAQSTLVVAGRLVDLPTEFWKFNIFKEQARQKCSFFSFPLLRKGPWEKTTKLDSGNSSKITRKLLGNLSSSSFFVNSTKECPV